MIGEGRENGWGGALADTWLCPSRDGLSAVAGAAVPQGTGKVSLPAVGWVGGVGCRLTGTRLTEGWRNHGDGSNDWPWAVSFGRESALPGMGLGYQV